MLYHVKPEESGIKLQAFLKSKLAHLSARQIKHLIDSNKCKVNGRMERFASTPVGAGDVVEFLVEEKLSASPLQFEPSRLLYEDADLLIYNKPSSVASDNEKFCLALQRDNPSLALLHRLDKDTTGVLLFAKSEDMEQEMLNLFKERLINKEYLAIIDGLPTHASGTIDNYLGEIRRYEGQVIWGKVPKARGHHAVTEWESLKRGKHASLVRCFPKTGRTHQIRVHFSEMGHPLLGDFQYSKTFHCKYRAARCMLHAEKVSFIHPGTHKELTVAAPIPEDMERAIRDLFI